MEANLKRSRWAEADVVGLPAGEHDYFDRKSGSLFDGDRGVLLGTIAKALSAFANSGGGQLVLGVADDGASDGVPRAIKGRTSTREWLEQKVPHLLAYALTDFRVHVVERDPHASVIPAERDVIVIDVGDSGLAPHQCLHDGGDATKYLYYMRQAGHSVPAPHFYVELLRQRLTNAALTVTPGLIGYSYGAGSEGRIIVLLQLPMTVETSVAWPPTSGRSSAEVRGTSFPTDSATMSSTELAWPSPTRRAAFASTTRSCRAVRCSNAFRSRCILPARHEERRRSRVNSRTCSAT
jgi:hypothetical protein